MADDSGNGVPDENVWKRLTRLFRSGPVVRHKIAAGEAMPNPQGTAKAFKRELSSLYVRALSSYANYERLSRYSDYSEMELTPELHSAVDIYCLAGESRVLLTDGVHSISDLFDSGRTNFWLYSFCIERDRFVPGLCRKVMKTGEGQSVFRVNLDNGNFVRMTGEHLVLLSDGSYRAVCDLAPGDHIRSLYRDFSSKEMGDWIDGYERILQPSGKWEYSHRIVAEHLKMGNRGDVIHHVDFNKLNNDPSNLQFMSWDEHKAVHLDANSSRWKNDPAFVKRMTGKFSRHAKMMHAQPGWTREVFLKARNEVFASYTPEERREKFGRPGKQNGQFGRGDLHAGPLNGRFDTSAVRTFSAQQLQSLMDRSVTIREAAVALNTFVDVIRSEMKRLGIPRWTPKAKPRTQIDDTIVLSLKREAHRLGDSAHRLFGQACSNIGVDRSAAYLQLKLAGYKNWGDFIGQTNHVVVSVEEDGRSDVFDLEVEGLHNFAVSGRDGNDFIVVHNSDEATVRNDDGDVIEITSRNAEIKETLESLFFDVIDINFNAWSWMRHFVKFGDLCLFVDANDQHGILNLIPIPINEIEREEGFDAKDPLAVRFRWLTRGNTLLQNWQIIHFRLLGNDAYLPYGSSVLEPARRIWRQLILIEDAMLVYRIVRSPERRVFHIEIANTPPDQVDAFIEQVKTQMKRNTIVDPSSGRVDLRYNPLPVRKDTRIPLLDGRTLAIEELAREFDEGKTNWVYSIQDETKRVVPGKIAWCGRNYTCDRIHRVWLDDGSYVDTAPEHPFILRNGTSRRADELTSGDSLLVVNRDICPRGYERLTGPYEQRISTHAMVARDVHRIDWESVRERVVHHKTDLGCPNKRNNNPDRLEVMNFWEHRRLHQEHAELTLNRPELLLERAERFRQQNITPEFRARTVARNRQLGLAVKMGAAYNGSELHKSHNSIRREAQVESWGKDKESRSAGMRWIIPNEVMSLVFSFVKENPRVSKYALQDMIKGHTGIRETLTRANEGVNKRKPESFHFTAIKTKLERMGEIPNGCGYPEFRSYLVSRQVPMNHQVTRVEVLEGESDDVYCMTVMGSNGEDDRHNFAVDPDIDGWSKSLIFLRNSVEEDFFLPKRGEQKSVIDTLAGGQFTGDIEDVQYIQSKMFAAIKIPRAYLGYEDQLGSKATLAQEDVRFSRTIERIQSLFVAELNKIAIIHLFLCGFSGEDLRNFEISMANPSTVAAQQRLELWRMKLEVAGMAQEGMFDRGFVHRKIFGLNDKQIAAIKDGKRIDQLEDALLQSIEAPPVDEPAADGATTPAPESPEPGAEELPNTLGGPAAEAPAPEPQGQQQQNAGLERPGSVIGERFNRGSTGSRAELAVDKGKDLFSTGESPLALSFGTEKQTASDPNDHRAARRLVTRPFSEDPDVMPGETQIDESEELVEQVERLLGRRRA